MLELEDVLYQHLGLSVSLIADTLEQLLSPVVTDAQEPRAVQYAPRRRLAFSQ